MSSGYLLDSLVISIFTRLDGVVAFFLSLETSLLQKGRRSADQLL